MASQFDEDTHILAVLDEIGHGNKVLADIGARLQGSNSARLIEEHGWTGTLVDRGTTAVEELRATFPHCDVRQETATPQNVNQLVPRNARFLSIDVDSCDWWLWANLVHRPALVVIETNPVAGVYVAAMGVEGGYGCSVDAAVMLGRQKGYDYIGRNVVNAFFVLSGLNCTYRLPAIEKHVGDHSGTRNNAL